MVALLQYRQGSKEHYEYYPAGQVKDKLIDVTVPEAFKYFHPLWVLGLFFVGYSAFAMVGVLLGLELRRVGFEIKVSR